MPLKKNIGTNYTQSSTEMIDDEPGIVQGDIVWAQHPLTDKVDKLKCRPVLIISSSYSNSLDNDYVAIPITKTIRHEPFSLTIEPDDLSGDLPIASELRCNKPFTVRNTLLHNKIGVLIGAKVEQTIRLAIEAIEYRPRLESLNAEGAQL